MRTGAPKCSESASSSRRQSGSFTASGLGAAGQWREIGAGVAFALGASTTFGLALVLTQHEAGGLDGRLRTFATMAMVALLAGAAVVWRGGLALPVAPAGWWGLALLTLLYGTGITILFTVLPRLGVVGNSAVMNVEPVFALVLAWLILDQHIAPVQVVVASITDAHAGYAQDVAKSLQKQGLRVQLDLRNEKIGYKIREHSLQRLPYQLVVGDKEKQENKVAVRRRGGEDLGQMPIEDFIAHLKQEIALLQH